MNRAGRNSTFKCLGAAFCDSLMHLDLRMFAPIYLQQEGFECQIISHVLESLALGSVDDRSLFVVTAQLSASAWFPVRFRTVLFREGVGKHCLLEACRLNCHRKTALGWRHES